MVVSLNLYYIKAKRGRFVFPPEVSPNTHARLYNHPRNTISTIVNTDIAGVRIVLLALENWRFSGEGVQTLCLYFIYFICPCCLRRQATMVYTIKFCEFSLISYPPILGAYLYIVWQTYHLLFYITIERLDYQQSCHKNRLYLQTLLPLLH